MDELLSSFKIQVPTGIYKKDPQTSKLGKKIIEHSILLISKHGFESFNFKKLGIKISSNESSIYRYFESKHHLLMYLTSWYWTWIEYQLVLETFAIKQKSEKLKKSIEIVTRTIKQDSNYNFINEVELNKIIINENSKSYLTINVDDINKEGFFSPYKQVVKRLSVIIKDFDINYKYPLSLANSVIDGALHQHYFRNHFKTITECENETSVTNFYQDLIFNTLT